MLPVPWPLHRRLGLALVCCLLGAALLFPRAATAEIAQSPALLQAEQQVVYLANLERAQQGLPPLRWNRELSLAAQWFAQDSVEGDPAETCDHIDSKGRNPGQRMRESGYIGLAGWGENIVCGYLAPDVAVDAWMRSEYHRNNVLNAYYREIGIGYYLRSDGTGFIVMDLGADPAYAPVIIENEAISTLEPEVELYVYDPGFRAGFTGIGAATEMMVSNEPDFSGAGWEPYTPQKSWTLNPGTGWRSVYVKTRDRIGRTAIAHDTIYLGPPPTAEELSTASASRVEPAISLKSLPANGYTQVGFSLDWIADETDPSRALHAGEGNPVNDASAWGGAAFLLKGGRNSTLGVESSEFYKELSAVAYLRLKIADNAQTTEAVHVDIKDGALLLAERSLRGSDFSTANGYQEFAVPFTLPATGEGKLIINTRVTGSSDVTWDAITFYTAPQPITDTLHWVVPDRYFRSRGLQVRFSTTDGSFSEGVEGYPYIHRVSGPPRVLPPPALKVTPTTIVLNADAVDATGWPPTTGQVTVNCTSCSGEWKATTACDWLELKQSTGALVVTPAAGSLAPGVHYATVRVQAPAADGLAPVDVTVSLLVGPPESVLSHHLYLPSTRK
ncbi:MAG: CAP domain-containing protein [Anaerolineales bacterium]|nr:CAP domain-containing protein [Anaerolineales bacterium]